MLDLERLEVKGILTLLLRMDNPNDHTHVAHYVNFRRSCPTPFIFDLSYMINRRPLEERTVHPSPTHLCVGTI